MFTVALIGPDGAGKTMVCKQIKDKLPLPTKYVYMGVGHRSANVTLPTTWCLVMIRKMRGKEPTLGGRPQCQRFRQWPKGRIRKATAALKSCFGLINQLSEEWLRQLIVWCHQIRGNIVLLDRHICVEYANDLENDIQGAPLRHRIHSFFLQRVYPKPDLVVYLDAPAEILYARKREGTLESLDRMRKQYVQLRNVVRNFTIVDASQPQQDVVRDVCMHVWTFYKNQVRTTDRRPRCLNESTPSPRS